MCVCVFLQLFEDFFYTGEGKVKETSSFSYRVSNKYPSIKLNTGITKIIILYLFYVLDDDWSGDAKTRGAAEQTGEFFRLK